MPWSAEFLAELIKPVLRPRFLLEPYRSGSATLAFNPGSGHVALSSHALPGYTIGLTREGCRYSAGQLQAGEWSHSLSELTLGYRGTIDIRREVSRGQLMVFRIGFPGWSENEYQAVYYGHVQSIDRSGDDWTITLRSIVATVSSRMTQTANQATLFGALGGTTVADTKYMPADTALRVTSTAAAERESGGGGIYLVQVFPNEGDPFFLTATGVATGPTRFTGVSTAAILGTTAAESAIGNEVKFCAHFQDSPTRGARRVLMSTGGALNGQYDSLPVTWGLGIPQDLVDDDDCDTTKVMTNPVGVGSPNWNIFSVEPQDDGLSWLQGVLGPAGLVLCERQGQLTIRAVMPPYDQRYETFQITDKDIVSIDRHSAWDPDSPIEFAFFGVINNVTSDAFDLSVLEEQLDSRPASHARWADLLYVHSDEAAWRDSVRDRIGIWSTRVPEIVELTCQGLRLARMATCDGLVINSRHFVTRNRAVAPALMVLKVEPDWWAGSVKVIAAYIPENASEY